MLEHGSNVHCWPKGKLSENVPKGQWIKEVEVRDGRSFHCVNRRDEKPFSEKRQEQSWMMLVNTPCDSEKEYRRCLGLRPEKCVLAKSKSIH